MWNVFESHRTTFRKGTNLDGEEVHPVREGGVTSVGPPLALFEEQGPGGEFVGWGRSFVITSNHNKVNQRPAI